MVVLQIKPEVKTEKPGKGTAMKKLVQLIKYQTRRKISGESAAIRRYCYGERNPSRKPKICKS